MSSFRPRHLQKRALLTETLPAELPIIFSNKALFASTLPLNVRSDTALALSRIRSLIHSYTVPLDYGIRKGREGRRGLSIVHPNAQIRMADFVDRYAETIIAYCSKNTNSVRRPASIVSLFSEVALEKGATARDGLPHELLSENSLDYSNISSYFRYDSYNLLGKFVDSREFTSLESKFPLLRTLDISKCFYNIYTHSVTWATKNKEFSKKHRHKFSFESEFDGLMQSINYSETNGIVVGPELSRIFAEIILQEIDKRVIDGLPERLRSEDNFAIRRYIDDYYVFAKSESDLDCIQDHLSGELAEFKLYLNQQKKIDFKRPFVTKLSLAKWGLSELIGKDLSDITRAAMSEDLLTLQSHLNTVARRLNKVRAIVAEHDVGIHNVSGLILASLRREIGTVLNVYGSLVSENARELVVRLLMSMFSLAFYVTSVDLRVRTSFSLMYLLLLARRTIDRVNWDDREWLDNYLFERHVELTTGYWNEIEQENSDLSCSIEISNLMCGGAYIFGPRFAEHGISSQVLSRLSSQSLTYFSYITLKYVMLKSPAKFTAALRELNKRVEDRAFGASAEPSLRTDDFLLMCDYLSSPDITPSTKLAKFTKKFGGTLSKAGMEELSKLVGFIDWEGATMEHTLRRQHLRPTYSAF